MIKIIFITAALVLLAISILLWALALLLSSRLFKLENPTYKKSAKIIFLTLIANVIIGIPLGIIIKGLVFFAFYYFLKRYYEVRWLKSLGVYTTHVVIAVLLSLPFLFPLYSVSPWQVMGEAMLTVYNNGDSVLIYKLAEDFSRGDIIVFRSPNNEKEFFIKRVIGLPGEEIKISGGEVIIDGKILRESYLPAEAETPGYYNAKLEKDEYFVLGDNRLQSRDSRSFGSIKQSFIKGKVFYKLPRKFGKFIPKK
ncbi:signal peptidase I [Candidatus Wolfebacteria bacterium]|nr:signal peptidase I [Candidatus Wolfebacteria bacterium]